MAAIWRRAWRSKKVSSAGRGYGAPHPIFGGGSSSSTTTTSGTRTTMISSEPFREEEEEESSMERLVVEVVKTRRHMRDLVQEFCAGADGNAATAPDRWLSELHVAWLLRPAQPELGASGQRILVPREMQSWILALQVIRTSVRRCLRGLHGDDEAAVGPPASEFAQFLKATLLKMLTFVDAIVALDPFNVDGASSQQHVSSSCVVLVGAADKVRALLHVRNALSAASEQIVMDFCSSPYMQSTKVADDIGGLLSAQLDKLDQAIRDTFDHIRTAVTLSKDDDNDSSSPGAARDASQTTLLQSSPDIHKVTRSVMNYINNVLSTEALLHANYSCHQGDTCSLTTQTMRVVCSLEEELARLSQSFPDQSLRFIFLINNTHFIRQQLHPSWPPHLHLDDLTCQTFFDSITNRINRYIWSYLQVSWEPVLKCLRNPTFRCFTRDSPLPKFESKFQSTYAAQKLWKVPDPGLRRRLREVVIKKVVKGFEEYLEDHNSIIPGVTPQELKEILQELFEG